MGKIKRERQKFHITTNEEKEPAAPKPVTKPKNTAAKKALQQQFDAVENIFAGINIQLDSINKLEDVPPPPPPQPAKAITTAEPEERETDAKLTEIQWNYKATAAEKQLTKKEKLKLKHAKLMEKIDVTQQARLKVQEQRKQKKLKSAQTVQSPLPSRAEIKSILTPAAMKSSKPAIVEKAETKEAKETVKNIFAVPKFNDDLPALNIFKINPIKVGVADGSKAISKGGDKQKSKQKKNFVQNVNLLKKLMAKKKK